VRESERRDVLKAIARLRSGDLAGALLSLRALAHRPTPSLDDPAEQLLLGSALVECRVGGTIPLRDCLTRRSRTYPSGGRAGARGGPKGQLVNLECKGCPLGEAHAQRAPGFLPPAQSRPAEVLSPAQRQAKRRAQAEGRLRQESGALREDPLAVVASMTPDDEGAR
jgi:hypothetical protein